MSNLVAQCHHYTVGHILWWHHQMETFFELLALCAGNSPVTGEFPLQRPVTQSFDISLICAWTNSWVNNLEAGDMRCHHTHYDVIVMFYQSPSLRRSVCLGHFFNSDKINHPSLYEGSIMLRRFSWCFIVMRWTIQHCMLLTGQSSFVQMLEYMSLVTPLQQCK